MRVRIRVREGVGVRASVFIAQAVKELIREFREDIKTFKARIQVLEG